MTKVVHRSLPSIKMINSRDYNVLNPVESLTEYGDGGLLPIHINDQFQNGRYQILNKLGNGSFSTVWAARDHHKHIYVSLKVIRASYTKNNHELRILQRLQESTAYHPGYKHLPQLLDFFYEESLGKENLFLVLELLGPPLKTVLSNLPGGRFSLPRSRQISRQLLLAIDCLHSHGIVHGDIYEGNILFCLPDSLELNLDHVHSGAVSRKDGAPLEKGIPRYLVETLDFRRQFNKTEFQQLDCIQLIDFSSSFFDLEPPALLYTPFHVAPPELIFQKRLANSVDIWSHACTTFYFATGHSLFYPLTDKRDNIPQIYKAIGESSAQWLLSAILEAVHSKIWEDLPDFCDYNDCHTLEDAISVCYYNGRKDISNTEELLLGALARYLRKALIVAPLERATTKGLQAEEWVDVAVYSSK